MQRSCATSGTSLRVPTVAPVGVAVEVWFSTAYQLPYWYMVFGILQPTTVTGMAYSFRAGARGIGILAVCGLLLQAPSVIP